jgi:hypothetical protein
MTELASHPSRRATSFKESPASTNLNARRRRSERTPAEPLGLMSRHPPNADYCIIYEDINNPRFSLVIDTDPIRSSTDVIGVDPAWSG